MSQFLDIFWWIYRIVRSIDSGNAVCLVLEVVLLVIGIPFWWLVDIVYYLLKGKALVFEDLL